MASMIVAHNSSSKLFLKPWLQRSSHLPWNPIAGNLRFLEGKNGFSSGVSVQCDGKALRKMVANVVPGGPVPGVPVPSGPPSSNSMSWILGFVVSFILPFFTHKWGPLWVVKNRIENTVQTVENIVEGVEKIANEVDKFAEHIAEDLPEGNLKNLVKMVEHAAEETAKTADRIDNVIDQVQEAEEQVESVVESMVKGQGPKSSSQSALVSDQGQNSNSPKEEAKQ